MAWPIRHGGGMIRVLVSVSSPEVKARLLNLLRAHPEFEVRSEPELDLFDDSIHAEIDSGGSSSDAEPDVVLADLDDEGMATSSLGHFESGLPTILLAPAGVTGMDDPLRQGIRALLPRDLNESRLVAAIEAVAAGLGVFMPGDAEPLAPEPLTKPAAAMLVEPLTPRELEILRAMADGLGNKEIASHFNISENTVKFHVASVMSKLGAGSRTEAVILGIRHGLVFI